jgi:hypothetical protein
MNKITTVIEPGTENVDYLDTDGFLVKREYVVNGTIILTLIIDQDGFASVVHS